MRLGAGQPGATLDGCMPRGGPPVSAREYRVYGSFMRQIPMPIEIDKDKVEARFDKGVLTVILPKSAKAEAKTKRIAIQKGA